MTSNTTIPQAQLKILLVEDDPDDAFLLCETLDEISNPQFELTHVERLADAFEQLDQEQFDAIFLDLSLPDSQGINTFTQLNTHAPENPIIVLTGLDDESLALEAVQAGAQDYLVKGTADGNLLARAVNYAVERKRLMTHLEARLRELQTREALLTHIIQQNPSGTIIVDGDGVVLFINSAAADLFGCEVSDMLGELFGLPVIAGQTEDIDLVNRNGEIVTAEAHMAEIEWDDQAVHIVSLRNITEHESTLNYHRLTEEIQDESTDFKIRLAILDKLKRRNKPEALAVLARGCSINHSEIRQYCRRSIEQLPIDKFEILWNFLFDGGFGSNGKTFLRLMDELREVDTMKHVFHTLEAENRDGKQYQLVTWLRQTGILNKYLRALLTMSPGFTQKALVLLKGLDSQVATDLVDLAVYLPIETSLGILKLLDRLGWGSDVTQLLLLHKFLEHHHSGVRACATALVNWTPQHVHLLQHALSDPIPEVRLNALKSIEKSYDSVPPQIIGVISGVMDDSDRQVSAKAVQMLYAHARNHTQTVATK